MFRKLDLEQAKSIKFAFRQKITGDHNLLGGLLVVPGARIELATPAFSERRSTNELPRLCWTFQF